MNRLQVISNWSAGRESEVALDYPFTSLSDVTGQDQGDILLTPSMVVVEGVLDDAPLATLKADSNYLVLWDEEIEDDA